MNRSRLIKVVITLVLVGTAVTLVAMSGMDTSVGMKSVDEVAKNPSSFQGKLLKLHGKVVPGTRMCGDLQSGHFIEMVENTCPLATDGASAGPKVVTGRQSVTYRLDLAWHGHVISLEQDGGEYPPTVKDDTELVATGRLVAPGQFKSTELSTKCASKYAKNAANKGGM